MQWTQVTHVEETMIARKHLNLSKNWILMEENTFPAWSPSPMQPECQVLTVNIPRGEQTHFDSSDNILENILWWCTWQNSPVKFFGNPADLGLQTNNHCVFSTFRKHLSKQAKEGKQTTTCFSSRRNYPWKNATCYIYMSCHATLKPNVLGRGQALTQCRDRTEKKLVGRANCARCSCILAPVVARGHILL